MSHPDPFLSQYYGTSVVEEPSDADTLEKMAQLHLLEKLAEDQEIDLSQYSDDEILAMTNQVFSDEPEPQATGYEGMDMNKVAAARFEEADFLGRVMAHSMWNELDAIQKQAAGSGATMPSEEEAKAFAKQVKADKGAKVQAAKERYWANKPSSAGQGHSGARTVGKTEGAARTALHKMKRPGAKGKAALIGAGILGAGAAAGLGAHALSKRKAQGEKTAALDTLSDSRAFDILAEHGFVTEQGEVIPPDGEPGQAWDVPFQKTASEELDAVVEDLAWGKLYDLGYLGE